MVNSEDKKKSFETIVFQILDTMKGKDAGWHPYRAFFFFEG